VPDSPRTVRSFCVTLKLETDQNPTTIIRDGAAEADAFVRHAIAVRASWVEQDPKAYPMPSWPAGAHGDLRLPGWMYPYIAQIVDENGPRLQVRGFIDLRGVTQCAIHLSDVDPAQISTAPFRE